MRYITTNQGCVVQIGDASAYALAKSPALQGRISEKQIRELIKGRKEEAKGFIVYNDCPPKRANKEGVEHQGTSKLRKRQPMKIYVSLTDAGRSHMPYTAGDINNIMGAIADVSTSHNNLPVEYSELASSLGWSRDMVAIYTARLVRLGYVKKVRYSNPIPSRYVPCQQI